MAWSDLPGPLPLLHPRILLPTLSKLRTHGLGPIILGAAGTCNSTLPQCPPIKAPVVYNDPHSLTDRGTSWHVEPLAIASIQGQDGKRVQVTWAKRSDGCGAGWEA